MQKWADQQRWRLPAEGWEIRGGADNAMLLHQFKVPCSMFLIVSDTWESMMEPGLEPEILLPQTPWVMGGQLDLQFALNEIWMLLGTEEKVFIIHMRERENSQRRIWKTEHGWQKRPGHWVEAGRGSQRGRKERGSQASGPEEEEEPREKDKEAKRNCGQKTELWRKEKLGETKLDA